MMSLRYPVVFTLFIIVRSPVIMFRRSGVLLCYFCARSPGGTLVDFKESLSRSFTSNFDRPDL